MSAEQVRPLLTAADVADEFRRRRPTDKPVSSDRVDRLAAAGRIPVAGRDPRTGRRVYNDRAISALVALRDD